jgi:hypothetical protein
MTWGYAKVLTLLFVGGTLFILGFLLGRGGG